MEKQYLDYNGLANVAGYVNTRLKTVTTMPVSADNGAVRLYVGTTTDTYIRGHIYQYNSTDSEWVDITSSGQYIQYSTMPTASADIVNKIVQYTGTTNQNYTNGYFYKCTLSGSNYIWTNINVQAGGSGSDNIINGYFNPTDNLFYEESTYTTAITGENNVLYISLDTDFSYRYNGSIFVRVDKEIDDTTTSSSKTWSSNKISSEITGIIGSIVTPTDDIQTWLKCADLTESYTTLSAVLADDDVMEKLFRSENASDYLVRSTTWASDICANQTAMILIGANDYCADLLMENSTWSAAICDSTYFESVLNVKIPAMTSNSQDGFVASASSIFSSSEQPYKAFTNDASLLDGWVASNGSQNNSWLQMEFPQAIQVNKISINMDVRKTSSYYRTLIFKLQGSNDGSTFSDIASNLELEYVRNVSYSMAQKITNSVKYKYYRFIPIQYNCTYGNGYMALINVNLYGRTSKTTIYSAANDIVSFIDDEGAKVVTTDATGKGEVNIVCKPNTDITFTSSVAKDPNNLSENYSKVVTVKSSAEPVYVMPNKNVLYWYGYKSSNLEVINSTNGWTSGGVDTPTFYTNYIELWGKGGGRCSGVGTKSSVIGTKKAHIIYQGITSEGTNNYGFVGGESQKYTSDGDNQTVLSKNVITYAVANILPTKPYIIIACISLRKNNIYAWWLDDSDADDKAEISAIGTNEDKPTASRAYAINDLFYCNGKIGKVIQPISAGAQFTLNTNYIETTICELITSLLNT